MSLCLLDTGPLVAYIDSGDPQHDSAVAAMDRVSGKFLTSGAVITEAFYFLRYAKTGPERLVEFLEESGATIADVFTLQDLRSIARLMEKYADRPMDFADATLVLLAEERNVERVLTLDERGFRAYRFRGNRRFRLVSSGELGER